MEVGDSQFIQNFAVRTHNWRRLSKTETRFLWTEECQQEFEDIKNALCSARILAHPDYKLPFILTTAASCIGYGAILIESYLLCI